MADDRSFSKPPDSADGTPDVARIVLYLSWLRSVGIVSRALADRFQDPATWTAQMEDPVFHEEILAFQTVVSDVRALARGGAGDLEALEEAGGAHIERAMDSLRLTAERFGITPDDLLVVLIQA